MAIAILAQDGQQLFGFATSRSIPFTVPAGTDCLLVSVACADFGSSGGSVAQVDWNGDAGFVRAVHRESSNAGHHVDAWILTGPAAGSGTITVTYDGTRGDDLVHVHALSGVDTADPVGDSDTDSHAAQSVNLSLTTEGAGSFLLAVLQTGGGDVWPMTINTVGWTAVQGSTDPGGSGSNAESTSVVAHATGGAAGTVETFSGDWAVDATWNGAFALIEIKAAPGGGTDVTAAPAGVPATGRVGMVSVRLDSTAAVTGVSATGVVGSVGVAAGAGIAIAVAGSFGTALVGAVAAKLGATAAVSGLGATAGLGTAAFFEWRTHEMPAAVWVEEDAASPTWLDASAAEGTWS